MHQIWLTERLSGWDLLMTNLKSGMIRAAAFALATTLTAGAANATTVTLNFGEGQVISDGAATGAAGSASFAFYDWGDDVRAFVALRNETGASRFGAGAKKSRLTAFGFDLIEGVAFAGGFGAKGDIDDVTFNADLSPFGKFDVLLHAKNDKSKKNHWNSSKGLKAGETGFLTFLFDTELNAASMADAYQQAFLFGDAKAGLRFEKINSGHWTETMLYKTLPNAQVSGVPVPTPIALLSGALLGLAALGKRRPKARQNAA